MTLYANLDFAKYELQTAQPTAAALTRDDMLLLGHLRQVSDRLDSEFPLTPRWPFFAPWYGSRTFLVNPSQVNSRLNTFRFSAPLLALTGDVTNGTQTLVSGTNVALWPTTDQPPFYALRLLGCCGSWYDNCGSCGTPLQVTIPGIWGWHRNYASAWPTITLLDGAINASVTSIKVDNLSAPDPYGITPGISVGSLLQFDDGTGEFLEVTGIDPATQTAIVLRGVNGTSALAAAHADNVGVQVFQVETPVQEAVAKQAGLLYARRGKYDTVEVVGMTEIRYAPDWHVSVRAMMQGYV